MQAASILFETLIPVDPNSPAAEPACFADLNLDQVFAKLVRGREVYDLTPFFRELPADIETTRFRQDVMRDIAQSDVLTAVKSFSAKMRSMREQIGRIQKLHYQRQKERIFLDAIKFYCDAIAGLNTDLFKFTLSSRGMLRFRDRLGTYVQSESFINLRREMIDLLARLSKVEYQILVRDGSVTVSLRRGERDYSAEIARTFAAFRQDATTDYGFKFHNFIEMNHIEAGILDFVANLFPQVFSRLQSYYSDHQDFVDSLIVRWDREAQFYLCFIEYIRPILARRLSFCFPVLSATSKAVHARAAFDIALAHKLALEDMSVVTNDFALQGLERIIVVSGPNQGGKTTFARMLGQLHYLGRLGYPVPGDDAQLFFFDKLMTQFEREEDIRTHRGKLEDELMRSHDIMEQATPKSIVILNEVFTSTSLQDALFLARRLLDRFIALDLLCVCVTFMDELSRLGPSTVSFVSSVLPDQPTERTYQVIRRPADGRSYAMSIAEKYRLNYGALRERLSS